jgi:hypothetical protein
MSTKAIKAKLVEIVGAAVSAKSTFPTMPDAVPPKLPAVVCRWVSSSPEHFAFATKSGTVSSRNSRRRVRVYEVAALINNLQSVNNADALQMDAADAIETALDSNSELGGLAVEATITSSSPDVFAWDRMAIFGVVVNVSVTEEA